MTIYDNEEVSTFMCRQTYSYANRASSVHTAEVISATCQIFWFPVESKSEIYLLAS